jgi:hypothetical protein
MDEIEKRFEKSKKYKGRRHVGEMPFISCEKEWKKWINRHDKIQ